MRDAIQWMPPALIGTVVVALSACSGGVPADRQGEPISDSTTSVLVHDGDVTIQAENGNASADDAVVNDSGSAGEVELECEGDVTVSQDDAVVTALNDCGVVTITGDRAVVTLMGVDQVIIDADDVVLSAMVSGPIEVRGSGVAVTVVELDGGFTDLGEDNELISVF